MGEGFKKPLALNLGFFLPYRDEEEEEKEDEERGGGGGEEEGRGGGEEGNSARKAVTMARIPPRSRVGRFGGPLTKAWKDATH
jgi:hypothetical protein